MCFIVLRGEARALHPQGMTSFSLTALPLAAGEYAILRVQHVDSLSHGPQQQVLAQGNIVPRWGPGGGFLELRRADNSSVDLVRWGNNNESYQAISWSGEAVPALNYGTVASSFGRNLENLDSNQASDWSIYAFATPGGPNDVPFDALDLDGDGIPDTAEQAGGRFAGLNLYAMGARVQQKDIFIEVDYMNSTDLGITPQKEALDKVVATFLKEGYHLHFDVGDAYSPSFSPQSYHLGNSQAKVPYAPSIEQADWLAYLEGRANFYHYKANYMEVRRLPIFHYLLMGSSRMPDGKAGSSGIAELGGNDILISLGNWGLNAASEANRNVLINFQASIIMHELGHNLNLGHGGDDAINLKPNYRSSMNYLYALFGLGPTQDADAGDRYYAYFGMKSVPMCGMRFSACSTDFILDFSHGLGSDINEARVDERLGIGYGNVWVDYDNNDAVNTSELDLNRDGAIEVLHDFDDWAHINLPFQRHMGGTSGPGGGARLSPLNNDMQPRISEDDIWNHYQLAKTAF
ncbi:MAG: hypothetical protein R2880_02040 [Deinococcales bacterium]